MRILLNCLPAGIGYLRAVSPPADDPVSYITGIFLRR